VTAKLVFENLKNKPMRSLLSFLLIGVPVTLILTLVGLSTGMLRASKERARGVGADILVRASGTQTGINLSADSLPEKYVSYFRHEVPHVKLAMGVINNPIDFPVYITGINQDDFDAMSGGFTYLAGRRLRDPDDILVDELYAKQKKLHLGSVLKFKNHDWTLAGIIQGGKLARVVVALSTLQPLVDAAGKVTQVYVKLDDPRNTDATMAFIQENTSLKVNTIEEFTEAAYSVNNIPGLAEFTYVIMGIGVLFGFAVACLSMYMAVLQRTREIGILKALGASNGFILRIVLAEALGLGIGGAVFGIVMSFAAWWLIRTFVPSSLPMIIVPEWWPIAGGITLVGAGLGALYPGLSAARHDPIEALAYE
jgi:putative ABC transport system permease protein